jgi:hypothetical protein
VLHYLGEYFGPFFGAGEAVKRIAAVLEAQLGRDRTLPATPTRLHDALGGLGVAPGPLVWEPARLVFGWGRHAGRTVGLVASRDPDELRRLLGKDLPADQRAAVEAALARCGEPPVVGPDPGEPPRRREPRGRG